MKSFYINPATNDIELDGSNNIKMVDGDDELIQCVRVVILTNINEWFLNPDFGLDRSVFRGKKIDENLAIETLYAAILQIERITSIEDITFEYDQAGRKLTVNFAFVQDTGELIEGSVAA